MNQSDRSVQAQPAVGSPVERRLGPDAEADDLGWHALNYRTAHTVHAEAMWQELAACVERKTHAAVAAERTKLLPLLELMQEVFSIAAHGCTPDGDGVNMPTLLWAEAWQRRLSGPNVRAKRPAEARSAVAGPA